VLEAFAHCTRTLQSATQVTLSRVPECVEKLIRATLVSDGDQQPLARTALVRIAQFLDPVQFKGHFRRSAASQLDAGSAAEIRDVVNATMHLVQGTIDRLVRNVGTSGSIDDADVDAGLFAAVRSWDGWPARSLLEALRAYRDADKSDAVGPLGWWRQHAVQLAPLNMIARWVLCIPATSAESERAFSLPGRLVSPLRTRLKGNRVHDPTRLAGELRRRAVHRAAACNSLRAVGLGHDDTHLTDDDANDTGELMIESDHENDLRGLLEEATRPRPEAGILNLGHSEQVESM
jgi:hypothetical protein